MTREQIEGTWAQLRTNVKKHWNNLTDKDLDIIAGKKDILICKLQERYGLNKNQACDAADAWNGQP